jgi:hypothetical protein
MLYKTDQSRGAYSSGLAGPLLETDSFPSALGSSELRASRMITMGATDGVRARGCIITPLLDDTDHAEDGVFAVDLFGINPIYDPNAPNSIIGWQIDKLADINLTPAGNSTRIAKAKYGITTGGNYRVCDTIAVTQTDLASKLEEVFPAEPADSDGIDVYSPGSDAAGSIIIFDAFGYYGLLFDHAGSKKFNALVRTVT